MPTKQTSKIVDFCQICGKSNNLCHRKQSADADAKDDFTFYLHFFCDIIRSYNHLT